VIGRLPGRGRVRLKLCLLRLRAEREVSKLAARISARSPARGFAADAAATEWFTVSHQAGGRLELGSY
jgi:hypothetical protein